MTEQRDINIRKALRGPRTVTGVGKKSIPFEYRFLQHHSASSIREWKGFIVTASQSGGSDPYGHGDMKIWTKNGTLLCSQDFKHLTENVLCWNDLIVTGSLSCLSFWKLNQRKTKSKLKCAKEVKERVHSFVIWDDLLYVRPWGDVNQENYMKIYNQKGKPIHSVQAVGSNISIILKGLLWTTAKDTIYAYKKSEKHLEVELVREFKCPSFIEDMCSWCDERIACVCRDGNIQVFAEDGTYLMRLSTEYSSKYVTEWKGKLVCVTKSSSYAFKSVLLLWHANGTLFQTILLPKECWASSLVVINNELWHGAADCVRIWKPSNWKIERLLWLGWTKHHPSECYIASLPKDIVQVLISLIQQQ